jgi:hypothetical protein
MSIRKSLKLLLHFTNIVIKIGLIYLVAGYAFKTLADEDDFYIRRGINTFCQIKDNLFRSAFDPKVCTEDKYNKFIYLYIDSLPFDLFEFDNKFTGSHSKSFVIKHHGITDSGPVFSSFATGKISNKYEGSIAGIDNIFQQFINAKFEIRAFGYFYPIYEMISTIFFKSYENSKRGLHQAFCSNFIDLNEVAIDHMTITESLIFDQIEYFDYFNRRYKHFRNLLKPKKNEIFECLSKHFENSLSHFVYDVYTDTIGHQYSRQSMIYLNKIAALKANLDILIQFIRDKQEDTLMIILSDHGVVSSLWETEISNHGSAEDHNESFMFLFNRKINKSIFNDLSVINSYDVPSVIAQLLENVNYPMNYKHLSPDIWMQSKKKLASLRQKESQILSYMNSFSEETLKKHQIDLSKLAKHEALLDAERLFNSGSLNEESVLHKYQKHIEDLNREYNKLLKIQNSDNWSSALLLYLYVLIFFIFVSLWLLWQKMKSQGNKLILSIAIFLSLPLIFFTFSKVIEEMFVWYNFVIMAVCLLILNLKTTLFELSEEFKSKITLFIIVHLLLFGLDIVVKEKSFFFLYYQNFGLQIILCVLFVFWSGLFLKQFLTVNATGFFSTNLRRVFIVLYCICDMLIIAYESKLMSSPTYFQDQFMIIISRIFYGSFIALVVTHFNFYHKRENGAFVVILKLIFWFGHNYLRLAYYGLLLPGYYIYLKYQKKFKPIENAQSKDLQLLRKILDYGLIMYHTLFVFYVTRGRLDTNISVRVGNRNWGANIEEIPAFTAIIFSINKFLPFIISYFLMLIFTKKLKDQKPKQRSSTKTFNCHLSTIGVRLSDIWFGSSILIYLNTFDNPETQRSSFMLYSSGLILIIVFYAFAVIDSILRIVKKKTKIRYMPIQSSN